MEGPTRSDRGIGRCGRARAPASQAHPCVSGHNSGEALGAALCMPCCVCGVCAAGVWAAAPRSRSVSVRRVLQQLASRGTQAANGSEMHLDLERIVDRISEYTFGFRGAHHDDQLYLWSFPRSRPGAVVQYRSGYGGPQYCCSASCKAAKLQSRSFEEAAELREDTTRMEFEEGGACDDGVEDPAGAEPLGLRAKATQIFDWRDVRALLRREAESEATKKPSRSTDAGGNMRESSKTLESTLQRLGKQTHLKDRRVLQFPREASQCLALQSARSQFARQSSLQAAEPDDVVMDAAIDTEMPATDVSRFNVESLLQGTARIAWKLSPDAGLNEDQLKPVALLAIKMQAA